MALAPIRPNGPPAVESPCLDAELLARYIEGRTTSAERATAEAHLARCENCYFAFAETIQDRRVHVEPALAPSKDRVVRPRWTPRLAAAFYPAAAGLLAVAATLTVIAQPPVWLARWRSDRPELVELAAAVGADRPTLARLTGDFAYGPPPSANRGESTRIAPDVTIAAARIQQALQQNRSARQLAAFATSRLVLGQPDEAVKALEEAAAIERQNATFWADLSAAYLTRADQPERAMDVPHALEAAETATRLAPSLPQAWFNKALILERLQLRSQAIAAWEHYLTLDAKTRWADEAREHLSVLQRQSQSVPPHDAQPLRDQLFNDVLTDWAAAIQSGQTGAPQLEHAVALTRVIDALSPDAFARDVVAHVREAQPRARRLLLANGHGAYGAAQAEYKLNHFEAAQPLFAQAQDAFARAGSPLEWMARTYAGIVAYRQPDWDRAVSLLQDVRDSPHTRSYSCVMGRTDWMLGLIAARQGRRQDAEAAYRSAIDRLHEAGEPANAAFVLTLLATNFEQVGDVVRAWNTRIEALQATDREGPLLSSAMLASSLGWHHVAATFEEASAQAARNGNRPPTLADALRLQALTLVQLGDIATAGARLAEARAVIASHPDSEMAQVIAEADLTEALMASVGDRGRATTETTAGIAAATRALAYFQRPKANAEGRLPEIYLARARLERRTGLPGDAQRDLRAGIDVLRQLRQYVAPGLDQATFTDVVRRVVDEYVDLQIEQGSAAEAFAATEEVRARDLPAALGSTSTPTIEILERTLPPATVVVDFVIGDARGFVWAVRRGQSRPAAIAAGGIELAQLIDAVTPPRHDVRAAARLRDLLVGPWADFVSDADLIVIVPDGPLHRLPFAALPGRHSGYLIEETPVLIAPSVSAWLSASADVGGYAAHSAGIVAVGNPRRDRSAADLPDLPRAEEEARTVASFYPKRTIYTGEAATREAVVSALETADVLHFAGHALVNVLSPLQSRLVVWDPAGRFLTAGDIRGLSIHHTRLVVLAACRSTVGPVTRSDGPLGLARAFLIAGVPSLVAAQWLVDDRASLALFERFHQDFARTGDAARSLQAAQLALLRSSDARLHEPEHWAGFVAIGGVPIRAVSPHQ